MLSWLHRTLERLYLDRQRVGRHGRWSEREKPPEVVSLDEMLG